MSEILTDEFYIIAIALLLPLTACMLVSQVNPYHALVIRGILGAVAALVYALFGAADVALTEALVGTMLSITLYAVAVRSSMSMRLGVLDADTTEHPLPSMDPVLKALRPPLDRYYLRLEIVPYSSRQSLHAALLDQEVHAICEPSEQWQTQPSPLTVDHHEPHYHLQIRIRRLYDILQAALPAAIAHLTYSNLAASSAAPISQPTPSIANPVEGHL
ncbi:MAG: DUF4040 domain-containing protein [Leptolyngbya sp. DLM2.Bin15]|nr:MAG: DUF4040 domain-containing protein [Leptolyngbya sp. DLM2.Bin15]